MAIVRIFHDQVMVVTRSRHGPVAVDLTRRCLHVTAAAKAGCPVNTNRLRSSIRFVILETPAGLVGLIGSDVHYAAAVHDGTRPHFPPPAALTVWASRHGFASPWPVTITIGRRGTEGHPFLRDALPAAAG
jgi:hypothetical protein